ncbi:MAG: ribonuclease Z [Candidatus Cloacimonetes bacterium 4572_55]|nr:MAG: ribonuclease Z [Candidatus Cloacimonetes bacterium 4572_55]
MFELLFLGTSASIPTAKRNTSCAMAIHEGRRFMIDAGEGAQRQMRIANVGMKGLQDIFLTHHHIDHIIGLGGLLFTLSQIPPPCPITIYGNRKTLDFIETIADAVWDSRPGERDQVFRTYEISSREELLREDKRISISGFEVGHGRHQSFGFIFQEKSFRRFLPDQARKFGVPEGRFWGILKQGENVTLDSDKIVYADAVLDLAEPGAKLVYIGDCHYDETLIDHARGADCLVCEATFLDEHREFAEKYGHLTARQAAHIAREAEVGMLYLNHRSRRYEDRQVEEQARSVFPDAHIARDFDRISIQPKIS